MNVIVLYIVRHLIMYFATNFYYHYLKIIQKILQQVLMLCESLHTQRKSFADTTIFHLILFCYKFIILVNINYYTKPRLALQARLVTINTCQKLQSQQCLYKLKALLKKFYLIILTAKSNTMFVQQRMSLLTVAHYWRTQVSHLTTSTQPLLSQMCLMILYDCVIC